jgi:hypothetical protein
MASERKKATDTDTPPGAEPAPESVANKTVVWDDKEMRTSYANVINVISTQEEFSLFFGTNQTWNLAEAPGLVVKLNNRVLLTPHAAKRLQLLLTERLAEYERRFGPFNLTRQAT